MHSAALLFFASAASLFWLAASVDINALLEEVCSKTYLDAHRQKPLKEVTMEAGEYDPVLSKAPKVEYVANCHANGNFIRKCNLTAPEKTTLELVYVDSSDTSVPLAKPLKTGEKSCTFTCRKRVAATLDPCKK